MAQGIFPQHMFPRTLSYYLLQNSDFLGSRPHVHSRVIFWRPCWKPFRFTLRNLEHLKIKGQILHRGPGP